MGKDEQLQPDLTSDTRAAVLVDHTLPPSLLDSLANAYSRFQ